MKKIVLLFICMMIYLCTGCSTANTSVDETSHNEGGYIIKNPEESHYFDESVALERNIMTGDITNQIVDIGVVYADELMCFAITENGDLHQISSGKLFSNQTNYKKVDTTLKFIKIVDEHLLGIDGNIYRMHKSSETGGFSFSVDEELTALIADVEDKSKIFTVQLRYTEDEVMTLTYDKNCVYTLDGKLFYTFPENETIIGSLDDTIITEKGYYGVDIHLEQEYVDSEAKEVMKLHHDEKLSNASFCKYSNEKVLYMIIENYLWGFIF